MELQPPHWAVSSKASPLGGRKSRDGVQHAETTVMDNESLEDEFGTEV